MGDLREALAAYSHDIAWSGWMDYMLSVGVFNPDGTWTMPKEYVERWTRQKDTPYRDLPKGENASDLEQADIIMTIIAQPEDAQTDV